jgi:class 3 adenylate cyclase
MPIFLYTDIEGSTQLWEKHGEAMSAVLDRHDEILMRCIEGCGGRHVKNSGDGMLAVFEGGETEPLECALAMQRKLADEKWPAIDELRVRVAVHAGPADYRAGDYFGSTVNRLARLMATAWGGQIIVTPEVIGITPLPDGARLVDLGVHLLKDLTEPQQIFGLLHENLKLQEFPALRSMSSRPNNLPRQPTPLVGREDELAEIGELLARPDCRLLTLVAPGGMGKTRLGLQAAAEQINVFQNGVFFVPLAGVTSVDNLPSTIANALNLSFYGAEDLEIQLHNYLREKQLLLLLDNFEHLIAGAKTVSDILAAAPGVKIVATSRRRLLLQAEWTFDVPGLSVPENGGLEAAGTYGSVELFLQSARRVQPGFSPTMEDLQGIVRVCRIVEGMPLALILAAAWVNTLSCQEIADEIQRTLIYWRLRCTICPDGSAACKRSLSILGMIWRRRSNLHFPSCPFFEGALGGRLPKRSPGRRSASCPSSLINPSWHEMRRAGSTCTNCYANSRRQSWPKLRKIARQPESDTQPTFVVS